MGWLFLSTFVRSNWNLECWYFAERGKLEDPEKTPWSKDKNQQRTKSTCDARSKIWTQFTVVGGVGGKHSHYHTIHASTIKA